MDIFVEFLLAQELQQEAHSQLFPISVPLTSTHYMHGFCMTAFALVV